MPPWSDLAVLLSIVLSTGWWILRLRRRGIRGGRRAAAGLVGFLGLSLIITMTAHCIDILHRLSVGIGHDGAPFVYDFRAYALLLLGVVLIACGGRLLSASLLIGACAPTARKTSVREVLTVLGIVAPLVPIHGFFAVPLCVIAGVAMLLVLRCVRSPGVRADPALGAVAALAA